MTDLIAEESISRQHFLFGIVAYWLFSALWATLASWLHWLEYATHPVVAAIGFFVLEAASFFWLFRKNFLWNIRWWHLAIVFAVIILNPIASYLFVTFTSTNDFLSSWISDQQMNYDITTRTLSQVKQWCGLIVSAAMLIFVWEHYTVAKDRTVHSFYAGMLFLNIFNMLSTIGNEIAGTAWQYTHHYVFVGIIAYPLSILIAAAPIYLILKEKYFKISSITLIILFVVSAFCGNFLNKVLLKFFAENVIYDNPIQLFPSIYILGDWVLIITAFYLYRKTMKTVPAE